MKQNCWEVQECGREPGGRKAHEVGVCPAATEEKVDGVHDGKNAGRCCWAIAGTLCGGNVCGTFAQKEADCQRCVFYKIVKQEEGDDFMPVKDIDERLQ